MTKGTLKILSKSVACGSTITPSDSVDIWTKPQDVKSKRPKAKEDPQAGKTVSKVIESIFDDPEMMISSADSDASGIRYFRLWLWQWPG